MDLAALHVDLASWLPLVGGAAGGALLLFAATLALTACSVPGVLIPISLSATMLLGPVLTVGSVSAGALGGSLLLFLLTRRFGSERLRRRFGDRLHSLESGVARYGAVAIVGLRVIGLPGPLITAGAALTRMRLPVFAAATLAGLLPSIVVAAAGPHLLLG
jgi:uncharacterized membrane protein YdjX (TVP38/TMEM64 family)